MLKKLFVVYITALLMTSAVINVVGSTNKKEEKLIEISQPSIEWRKTFDRGEFDHFHTVRQTDDEGYITCGLTEENDMFYVWLVKLDPEGEEEWSIINYDLNGSYVTDSEMWVNGFDVQQTSDGGYIVAGVSMILVEYQGAEGWFPIGFVWKTDSEGQTEWINHYYKIFEGVGYLYFFYNIIETQDEFVCVGKSVHYSIPTASIIDRNGLILRTDKSGDLLWDDDFDKGGIESFSSICQTSDGGFYISGFSDSESYNDGALWMVKTGSDGNIQWDKTYDGPGFEYTYGKGCYQTSDGGFILSGVTGSYGFGNTDIWLIKTDSSGNIEWDYAYGGDNTDYSWGICQADDGGIALGIVTDYGSFSSDKDDIMIVETDDMGNIEWKFRINEDGSEITRSIDSTHDGGYVLSAMTSSFGSSICDGVIVKISEFDNNRPSKPSIDGPSNGKPDNEYTFTATDSIDPDGGASLQYFWDWGDGNYSDWLDINEATYTWSYKDKFEIRVKTRDENGGESDWSDPLSFSTPRYKYTNFCVSRLIERFPIFEFILK